MSCVKSRTEVLHEKSAWTPDTLVNSGRTSAIDPAQYTQGTVDAQTSQVTVEKRVMAVDCGRVINPVNASGQVEGGLAQALGYVVSEEMIYDGLGNLATKKFGEYRIFAADEVPELEAILVQTCEPSGPYGGNAVASASYNAVGVRLNRMRFTPEKVWRALGVG
ncbi:MAG: xanthine dehydrogenase family protein molybdopterin-binding subunit [Caldilineaceae bacterium]|nr:xanthine dehydrogenase family protein molybdopterin-binding subunit [Caldilineaceae bacterium]MBP8122770.1 xanthine dehydrogenase family protein molybdopterin-binding subunit [Caldilineaceae bacterium]MBP9072918.1 xanthine dehydrogenase family protein molybdopterin-binding subunit [Caldilineaceae bacterium]